MAQVNQAGLKGEQDAMLREAMQGFSWPATGIGKERMGESIVQNDRSFEEVRYAMMQMSSDQERKAAWVKMHQNQIEKYAMAFGKELVAKHFGRTAKGERKDNSIFVALMKEVGMLGPEPPAGKAGPMAVVPRGKFGQQSTTVKPSPFAQSLAQSGGATAAPASGGNPFGQGGNPFGKSATNIIAPPPTISGGGTGNNLFGGSSATTAGFGGNKVFGAAGATSGFGGAATQTAATTNPGHSQPGFGGGASTPTAGFGQGAVKPSPFGQGNTIAGGIGAPTTFGGSMGTAGGGGGAFGQQNTGGALTPPTTAFGQPVGGAPSQPFGNMGGPTSSVAMMNQGVQQGGGLQQLGGAGVATPNNQPGGGVFGAPAASGGGSFGKKVTQGNPFGQQGDAQQAILGQQQGGLFGQQQPVAAMQQVGFSQQAQQQPPPGSMFGQSVTPPAAVAKPPGSFGAPAKASGAPFGSGGNQQGLFGASQQAKGAFGSGKEIVFSAFGPGVTTTPNFGTQAHVGAFGQSKPDPNNAPPSGDATAQQQVQFIQPKVPKARTLFTQPWNAAPTGPLQALGKPLGTFGVGKAAKASHPFGRPHDKIDTAGALLSDDEEDEKDKDLKEGEDTKDGAIGAGGAASSDVGPAEEDEFSKLLKELYSKPAFDPWAIPLDAPPLELCEAC